MTTTDADEITNVYLSDNFAPVAEEVTVTDLDVVGAIPAQLDGRYVRTGPNPIAPDPSNHHWFAGEGMVHGVRLRDGKAEWYRNRYVRSPQVTGALGEPAVPSDEGGLVPGLGNTNIVHHAGRLLALMELSLPFELTPDLDTVRATNLGGPLPAGINAHPKFDPDTNELHVMAYSFAEPILRYHVIGTDGLLRRTEELALGAPVMVHDMAMTDSSVIAFDLPVVFSLELAMAGRSMPFVWDPDYTPRVGVMPRSGSGADTTWIELDEPCYVYHPLNAYDDDGRVVMDLVVHPKAFANTEREPSQGEPSMQRWVLDPVAGTCSRTVIDERGQEFPRADERLAGRRHRYGYSVAVPELAGLGGGQGGPGGTLLGYDVVAGTVAEHHFGAGCTPSEFVFVPAAPDAAENEGWLMGYVHDGATDTSSLQILDATDVAAPPVARVELGHRVPQGFHGNWMPEGGA
ncbi:MAG: carotenoid oxygenase family protein [Acidimicrobiales bacterium]